MAGKQGFIYEDKIHNKLKAAGIVPKGFIPARSSSGAPDAMFMYGGQSNKLEIKLDLRADYGQGTLDYVDGVWRLGGANTVEALVLRELMVAVGIEQFANAEWGPKGPPFKGRVATEQFTNDMVTADYANFGNRYKVVPSSVLHNYYASKGTYYIQIGSYGLYHMRANPLQLPVPQFNHGLKIRMRTKRGGSVPLNNYRFTTALQITGRPGISPINLERDVDILKQ